MTVHFRLAARCRNDCGDRLCPGHPHRRVRSLSQLDASLGFDLCCRPPAAHETLHGEPYVEQGHDPDRSEVLGDFQSMLELDSSAHHIVGLKQGEAEVERWLQQFDRLDDVLP